MNRYPYVAAERAEKAITDATPLARDLTKHLDKHAEATKTAEVTDLSDTERLIYVTAQDLALSFQRISLYLNPGAAFAVDGSERGAHASLVEAVSDTTARLAQVLAPTPEHAFTDTDAQACRAALAAYWPLRRAYLNLADDEDFYTGIGYWEDDDTVRIIGVVAGQHNVDGGEPPTNDGLWGDSVKATDSLQAEIMMAAPPKEGECACGEDLCGECNKCSECGDCDCPQCPCGECLGCHASDSDDTLCVDCAAKETA